MTQPATGADFPPQRAYRAARQAARTALDEEPELTVPGRLIRHRIADAVVEGTWPIAFAAGRAAAAEAVRRAGGAFPDIRRQCANLADHGDVNDREPA